MKSMFLNRTLAETVMEEMTRDEDIILMGEDVINLNGAFSHYIGVPQAFPDRCFDMPIAELGYAHFGAGAAMAGFRPIIDLMFSDFTLLACDSIINTAAKYRYCSFGKLNLPVVYMMANGSRGVYGGWSSGCNHDQCVEHIYQGVAGLKLLMPFYPADVKGLLKSAIRDDDPVVFMYHLGSLGIRGDVPEEDYTIPINNAANILKNGKDVTVIAIHAMLERAKQAAEILEKEGIDIEIVDPRVIVPLDKDKICSSVAKTGRVLIVQEGQTRGGVSGEIGSVIAEECFYKLKAPIRRLGSLASPGPVGPAEYMMHPKAEDIVRIVKELVKC